MIIIPDPVELHCLALIIFIGLALSFQSKQCLFVNIAYLLR